MDRTCKNCKYCQERSYTQEEKLLRPYDPPDGYCTKIFPRGYVGAGKPGGKVNRNKRACFQFEPKEGEQG